MVNFIEIFDKAYSEDQVIKLAASLEGNSEHPIAAGIIDKQKEKELKSLDVSDFQAIKGKGVEGKIDGKT